MFPIVEILVILFVVLFWEGECESVQINGQLSTHPNYTAFWRDKTKYGLI